MRRLPIVLALLATPASATDILANAPDAATFAAVASQTGHTTQGGAIIVSGALPTGGSWYYNYVGTQHLGAPTCGNPNGPCDAPTAWPGVWARLRINGISTEALASLLAASLANGVTIYQQIPQGEGTCWSADGATCYADQSIGQIGLIM